MGCFFWGCKGVYILCVICVLLIGLYALWLKSQGPDVAGTDFLNKTLFTMQNYGPISWWSVSHYLFFLVLGALFPHCALPALTLGLLWEIFEFGMNTYQKRTRKILPINTSGEKRQYEQFWGYSVFDLIMNALGFYTGRYLRLLLDPVVNIHGCPDLNVTCK